MTVGRIPSVEGGIQPTIFDAKADLLTATANDTPARLAVGTNNQVVMADSAQATGLKYANEATATLTTTGDTLFASGANTLARRAIGTTGQVLTVSGGVPTWATPATPSAALTIDTIASGSLTSGSTLNLTGLTQDFLQLQVTGFTFSGGDAQVGLFPNASTTAAHYEFAVWDQAGGTTSSFYYVGSNPGFYLDNAVQTQSNANNGYIWTLQNCKQTGFTTITGQSYYVGSAGTRSCVIQGRFKTAAAITSLEFKTSNTRTFTAGTYSLIGG